MSTVNGQLVTCERCGETCFRRCVGEGEMDGGFTRWNKFEALPQGWVNVQIPVLGLDKNRNFIQVCPACHDLWCKVLVENFLPKKEGEQ